MNNSIGRKLADVYLATGLPERLSDSGINKRRKDMVEFGNYPAGITDCEVAGISGYCDGNCPILLRGDCENEAGGGDGR